MSTPKGGFMIRRSRGVLLSGLSAGALVLGAGGVRAESKAAREPKLAVVIVVDQFRYDYLHRHRDDFRGGIARLLERGAVFTNAHLGHYPSVTAIGHSALLTGARRTGGQVSVFRGVSVSKVSHAGGQVSVW